MPFRRLITLAATPVFNAFGKDACYNCLNIGMILFAIANGMCESVVNPLTATIYPRRKTHYLNILHAGWPGGLIVGGLLAFFFCGPEARIAHLRWEIPMAMFLIPTVIYGFITLREPFPKSEAVAAGVSLGQMLSCFASPVLLLLLLLHAMIGYVELGTDSWITNIMNNVVGKYAILLFIYTSALMFVLRFFAGPIVERVNPIGLLLGSSVLGMLSDSIGWELPRASRCSSRAPFMPWARPFCGQRFSAWWASDFPRGGAIVMGAMGGVGMLSAGLLGGPMIGYKQDYYASKELTYKSAETAERYQVAQPSGIWYLPFLPAIRGLDGARVAVLTEPDGEADLNKRVANLEKEGRSLSDDQNLSTLFTWWQNAKSYAGLDKPLVLAARLFGGRMALQWTALVPLSMAIGFGILFAYFASTGGYKVLHIDEHMSGEKYTGGVEGPVR